MALRPGSWLGNSVLCMALPVAGAASAQSISGQLGEQSRASIRISVSVAPAFRGDAKPSLSGSLDPTNLRPIDPSFRYSLIRQPLAIEPANTVQPGAPGEEGYLILIAPD